MKEAMSGKQNQVVNSITKQDKFFACIDNIA